MKSDNAQFGRRVGRAERVAEPARRRGQIDDRAAAGGLQHRHGEMRAQELARSGRRRCVRRQSSGSISSTPPVGPAIPALLTSASSPPSEACDVIEQARDVRLRGDVRLGASGAGMSGAEVGEELVGRRRRYATRAPRAMSRSAIARPMPEAPAVTRTRRFRERKDVSGIAH